MSISAPRYQNFDVAIYCRVYEVRQMESLDWLRKRFAVLQQTVKANKIYLETHRDWIVAEEATVRQAKAFLEEQGMKVAGGITVTVNESNRFQTYCYTNPEHREKLKEVVELTAGLFDELILDDFFFTNCKCPSCIQAKGDKSWTEFRLELMANAARDLVIAPAKAVNPNVKVVIKYPNWYEHFAGLGFNLDQEPRDFDGIYTGTETRDAVFSNQHLQPYHGYSIMRYFENIKPGGNGGGWVDPFGSRYADRYAEQLWITLFAKAREVTLFDFRIFDRQLQESERAPWQGQSGQGLSFDWEAATKPFRQADGALVQDASIALVAGCAFAQVDRFFHLLGKPVGIPSYKPYHSNGEDHLHSYLGMIGIPVDLVPEFPASAPVVLLTESAKFDPQIVEKIKRQLEDGKSVVITSGLLKALLERGIKDIVELRVPGTSLTTQRFLIGWGRVASSTQPVTVPQIQYFTNDSWEEISCLGGVTGSPLLHSAQYGKGTIYVLTIPENPGDLYLLPREVLDRVRETVAKEMFVRLDAPSQVALYTYDNDTFIVESFHDESVDTRVILDEHVGVTDWFTGETLQGEDIPGWRGQKTGKKGYTVTLKPHAYRVFRSK
jgi:hypothetical protein